MASPFDRFRKNQKTWLAVFGVALMVAWGVGGTWQSLGSSSSRNPVIVETKYGNYTAMQMASLADQRNLTEKFVGQVLQKSLEKQLGSQAQDPRVQQRLMQGFDFVRARLMGRRSDNSPDNAIIETVLLAKKAEQLGIVVSNETINSYLKEISSGSLDSNDVIQIIHGLSIPGKRHVTPSQIYDGLRMELLASKMQEMFQTSMAAVTPAQRWDYFVRMNRRATAEVMPIPVDNFLDKVKAPSQAELSAFFDKYKDTLPNPDSPEPGFKIPRKASFQYFKASPEDMLAAATEKVTDAEIAEYYEKNKTSFPASQLPKNEPANVEPAPGDTKPGDPEKKDEPKSDAPADKPADAKPEAGKPEAAKPEGEKQPEPAKPETPAAAPESEKKSSSIERSPFKLVSLLQEEKKEETKPADPAKPAEAATPAEKKDDTPAAAEKPAVAAPAEPKKEEPPVAEDKIAEPPKTDEKPKYEPLEKVKEEIRKTIARQKVNEEIRSAFDELASDMKTYATDVARYKAELVSDPNAEAPEALDIAALAKSKGISAYEIQLYTQLQIQDNTDIGKSFIFSRTNFRLIPFAQIAFSKGAPIYRPGETQDDQGNQYLYWKTKEEAEQVPSLDSIQSQVEQTWRLVNARPIALQKANDDAAKARAEKKTLAELYGAEKGDVVKTVGPFSWMSIGDVPMDPMSNVPHLSDVPGVTRAGEDFMRAVFKLQPGQTGAALNQPENIAYVIRLVDYDKPLEEVEKEFASADYRRYASIAVPDQRAMFETWMQNLETEARVKWIRPPVTHEAENE